MSTRYIQKYPNISTFNGGVRNLSNAAGFIYNEADDKVYVNGNGTLRPLEIDRSIGVSYFVDPQNGASTNSGLAWDEAFADFSSLDSILDDGDTIYLSGVFKGNWDTPYVNDVTLVGVANTPRQATDGGVANGGGATWLSTDTPAADDLLKITKQGWRVENIYFNNADTTDNSCCIRIFRDGETPEADASHAAIIGCKFTGEEHGIVGDGGPNYVSVIGCEFLNFDSAGDTAIKPVTGAGQGTFNSWIIKGNYFHNNVNHISGGAGGAFVNAVIEGNTFSWKTGGGVTTTLQVDLGTVGLNNIVMGNYFQNAHAETSSATMFLPQSTANSWLNYYRDGLVALVPAT